MGNFVNPVKTFNRHKQNGYSAQLPGTITQLLAVFTALHLRRVAQQSLLKMLPLYFNPAKAFHLLLPWPTQPLFLPGQTRNLPDVAFRSAHDQKSCKNKYTMFPS